MTAEYAKTIDHMHVSDDLQTHIAFVEFVSLFFNEFALRTCQTSVSHFLSHLDQFADGTTGYGNIGTSWIHICIISMGCHCALLAALCHSGIRTAAIVLTHCMLTLRIQIAVSPRRRIGAV